jgi:hypothetical protein
MPEKIAQDIKNYSHRPSADEKQEPHINNRAERAKNGETRPVA